MQRSDVEELDEFLEEVKAEDTKEFLASTYNLQSRVDDFVDDIEKKVNEAQDLLKEIASVGDLGNVEECLDVLDNLAKDLY